MTNPADNTSFYEQIMNDGKKMNFYNFFTSLLWKYMICYRYDMTGTL